MKSMRWMKGMVAAGWVALVLPAWAQAPGSGGGLPEEQGRQDEAGVRIRALAFQIREAIPVLYAHDPAKPELPPQEVSVKTYLNDQASRLPYGAKVWVFTNRPDPASAKDEASIVAKMVMPKDMKSGILIFLPGTGVPKAAKYQILAVNDEVRGFPRGSHKVLNLSSKPVRMVLETKAFDFKSGEEKVIEDPPVAANQSSGMKAFSLSGKDWQRVTSGVLPHPGQKRTLQIFFDHPQTKSVQLIGIRDIAVPD